jgi:hypothetical protein
MKTCLNWINLALLGLVLVVFACTYAPEEEYFKDVPQTDPVVSLSLNSYDNADTIYLWSHTNFSYNLDPGKGKLERVEILIDDAVIRTATTPQGDFIMDYYNWFKTGTYELKLQFVASSGTGSLAEKVGAEKIQVWRKWVLVIDAERPQTPHITFSEENGFLKINWPKYTKPNFVRYSIIKSNGYGNETGRQISNRDENFWIDSTYVGGYSSNPQYRVWVESKIGSTASDDAYKYDPVSFTAGPLNPLDSTVTVTWNKVKYPGALASYTVSESGTELYRTTEANDTSVTVKLKSIVFGTEDILYFSAAPKYVPNYYPSPSVVARFMLGTKLRHPGTYVYNVDRKQYIAYSNVYGKTPYFYLYTPDMVAVDSIATESFTPTIPVRGQYVYCNTSQGLDMLDLNTGIMNRNVMPILPGNFRATSTGLVNYDNSRYSAGKTIYSTTVYDVQQKKIIYSDGDYIRVYSTVSVDGNFILAGRTRLLKISNGSTTQVGTVLGGSAFIDFRGDDCNEMIFYSSNSVSIRNSNNGAFLRTIPVPFSAYYTFVSYDPGSKCMVWQEPSTHMIGLLNIETGASKIVKSYATTVVNGALFFGEYYIKLL